MDHEIRFVAHIDVLGMSALMNRNPELAWALLSGLVDARDRAHHSHIDFLDTAERVVVPDKVRAVTFSDTILLFTKGDSLTDLRCMLVVVAALLSNALHRCVPVRVGLASGVFYFNLTSSMYAGPALIEAYRLGEAQQWIGVTASEDIFHRATAAGLKKGSVEIISRAAIPEGVGKREGYVMNWPRMIECDIDGSAPLTGKQIYQGFERFFGPFSSLDDKTRQKYENTASFMNQQAT